MFALASRRIRAVIGKGRNKLANYLNNSMINDAKEISKNYQIYTSDTGIRSSKKLDRVLGEEAKRLKTSIKNINVNPGAPSAGNNYIATSLDGLEGLNPLKEEMKRRGLKSIIFHPKDSGVERLSHELGHAKRAQSTSSKVRRISQAASDPTLRATLNLQLGDQGATKGIKESIRGYRTGNLVVKEEKGATKEGLKLLKKGGMSKDDRRIARTVLNTGLNTYRKGRSRMWKSPLRELAATPDRQLGNTDKLTRAQLERRYYKGYVR